MDVHDSILGGDVNAGNKNQRPNGVRVCSSSRLNGAIIYNQSTFKYIYETLFTFSMRTKQIYAYHIRVSAMYERCGWVYQWTVFVNQFVVNSPLFIAKRKQINNSFTIISCHTMPCAVYFSTNPFFNFYQIKSQKNYTKISGIHFNYVQPTAYQICANVSP